MRLSLTYLSDEIIEELDRQLLEFLQKFDFRLITTRFTGTHRTIVVNRRLPWPTEDYLKALKDHTDKAEAEFQEEDKGKDEH